MSETTKITYGGRERVQKTSQLYAKAFETDPVITYLLCSMSASERIAYLPAYFSGLLTAAGMNDAMFIEADEFKQCSVVLPPGKRVDNPFTMIQAGFLPMLWNVGARGCQRMLLEYQPLSDASKKKGLKGQKKYYYVFFTATAEGGRGLGLCSKVMREVQERASSEGIPICLESTTEKSRKIYEKLGFEIIDEILIGKGKAGNDGNVKEGGEGVPIWSMIWSPKQTTN